ncbi:MAG TPA: HAD-IIA family hydrolase [Bacteroidales bacterium]|nr:HAD-IIA family hydrolase [Bacteroidales bacterium]HPT20549.1 HAD-IIA family hydrolase [Bacteroidales bacterium]
MDSKVLLTSFSDDKSLLKRIGLISHVALDMDGTIYKGDTLFPFTKDFLRLLRSNGISYSFLTNNPSRSTDDYLKHLKEMGLTATKNEIYTTAQATIEYIISNHPHVKRLFILGTPSMIGEFENAGFFSLPDDPYAEPDAVVVGFDKTLTYNRLSRAAWWINNKKPYFATNPDYVCPTDQPVTLVDCGSICAALEKATNRKPDVVLGKPNPEMLDGILKSNGLRPEEIVMVGDRIYTDMMMAHRANVLGALVLSGEATLEDAEKADPKPDVVVSDLEAFGELINESHNII